MKDLIKDIKALESSIKDARAAGNIQAAEAMEATLGKLKKKLAGEEKPSKTEKVETPEKPESKPKQQNGKIDACKEAIKQFNEAKKAEKAEVFRKEMLEQAGSEEEKEAIKALSVNEVLAKVTPKPRIDTVSKESLRTLVEKNIQNRKKNLPKKEAVEVSEEKIDSAVNRLYNELDKEIDKLLKS